MKAYTYGNGFLSLFDYSVRAGFVPCGKTSQKELHEAAYRHANHVVKNWHLAHQPACKFLAEIAKPDEIPTKEEFDKWMNKKDIVNALKDMK